MKDYADKDFLELDYTDDEIEALCRHPGGAEIAITTLRMQSAIHRERARMIPIEPPLYGNFAAQEQHLRRLERRIWIAAVAMLPTAYLLTRYL